MKKVLLALLVLGCLAGAAFAQPANCVSPTAITVPFTKDGAGEFCFVSTCMGSYINSWNMDKVEINGVDYTNRYADGIYSGGPWPAPMNGNYYIHYKGSFAWSHFEMMGTCSGATAAPTVVTTAVPTAVSTPESTPESLPTPSPTAGPTAGPTAVPGVGNVWISPASQAVNPGTVVTIDIHANIGSTALGAFGFTVTYPSSILSFGSIAEIASGLNLTNNTNNAGTIITAGFNANGVVGSSDLDLIRITLNATGTGTANIGLTVQNLNDTAGVVIGTPSGIGGTVIVGFITPVPTPISTIGPGVGNVWISPPSVGGQVAAITSFYIHVNTGNSLLGAFGFTLTYPTNASYFSVGEIATGLNLTINHDIAGTIVIAGFNATGVPWSADIDLIRVDLAGESVGSGNLGLTVQNLNDTTGAVIGTPVGIGGTINIASDPNMPTPVPTAIITAAPTPVPTGNEATETPIPTALPTLTPGTVRITPTSVAGSAGAQVTFDIHADTGSSLLGAFGFTVTYPASVATYVSVAEVTTGLNLTINSNTAGTIVIAGFNAAGITGSMDIDLVKITLIGTAAGGSGNLGLTVQNLNDTLGAVIGTPRTGNPAATITITAGTAIPTAVPTPVPTEAPPIDTLPPPTPVPTAVPTPTPIGTAVPGVGNVWISPASQTVNPGTTVTIEIHANTGSTALGAFGFTVTYPTENFTFVSIAEIATGLNLTNNAINAGTIVTAGFNASGVAGSSDLALIRITLNIVGGAGAANIGLTVQNLNDTAGAIIGTPSGLGATIQLGTTPPPTAVPTVVPTAVPTGTNGGNFGLVWITPATVTGTAGALVTFDIYAGTGSALLGAFGFTVTYPTAVVTYVSVTEITTGLNLTLNSNTAGRIVIGGFNATGAGSGDLALVRVGLTGSAAGGSGNLGLTVQNLNDTNGASIGTPSAIGGTITIAAPTAIPTAVPTVVPTAVPTVVPTAVPTVVPTAVPTAVPTVVPTAIPTVVPTAIPTAVPTVGPGVVWMLPVSQTVANGTTGVKVIIHANTGTSLLAAYGINVTFNSAILGSPAAAAESTGFMSAAGFATAGTAKVSGFDTTGKGPSSDLALFNLTFTAIGTGTSTMGVTVSTFVDPSTVTIGTQVGVGGTITVN